MCLSSKLGLSNSLPHVSQGSNLLDLGNFTEELVEVDSEGNEKSMRLGMMMFELCSSSLSLGDTESDLSVSVDLNKSLLGV